nr:hypothetical protein GCM10020093_015190 [Planobispora longispora]
MILKHCVKGFQLYREAGLDPVLRELGQARAGWARGSQFVFSQHCKQLRAIGVPDEKVQAVAHWQVSACFNELERAVLAYTDGLVLDGGRVHDEIFAVLRVHLTDEEILELTYITCLYEMHATMSSAPPGVRRPARTGRRSGRSRGYGSRDIVDDISGSG